jgi:hypothetical protein
LATTKVVAVKMWHLFLILEDGNDDLPVLARRGILAVMPVILTDDAASRME